MIIGFSPSFVRAYKKIRKKDPKQAALIKSKIEEFRLNPQNPSLRSHKLKGNLKESWSFSIAYNLRIVYSINEDQILLVDIGDHDEVY